MRANGCLPRGENNIAVLALSGATGEPVLIQSAPIRGIHPRCIDIDAPGQTLIAATRDKGIARDGPGEHRAAGRSYGHPFQGVTFPLSTRSVET